MGAVVDEEIGMNATYLYCLARSPEPPPLEGAPPGLPGTGPLRLLRLSPDVWVVAADAPLPDYGGDAIESRLADLSWVSDRAMAHERVVEHFAARGPVLPMKLFTLFTGNERGLAHLRERLPGIEQAFARTAGRAEWGVRVLFQEERARRRAAEAADSGDGSGRGFLLRKKAAQESARTLSGRVRGEVDRAYDDLAGRAAEARRRAPEAEGAAARLLLDAAFLVPQGDAGDFERAVREWADRLAGDACEVTLTGPWPPYNFLEDPA